MTSFPDTGRSPPAPYGRKPHRGGTVLTLGILSLVFGTACGVGLALGLIGWRKAEQDLQEMDDGVMDPSGRSMTQAGKVCSTIGIAIGIVSVMLWLFVLATSFGNRFAPR